MGDTETKMRAARRSKGLTMAALAKLVGTSPQQIDRLEKGARPMLKHWAERIAPHIGLTPQELIFPGSVPAKLPEDFAALDYDARKTAIVAFLRELAGPEAALEWAEILADIEEVALPLPDEPEDRPDLIRVQTQARALAVAAKRKLRRKTNQP